VVTVKVTGGTALTCSRKLMEKVQDYCTKHSLQLLQDYGTMLEYVEAELGLSGDEAEQYVQENGETIKTQAAWQQKS
jgi:hypothetical protein